MTINVSNQNDIVIMEIGGPLDTSTAPKVEQEVNKNLAEYKKMIINLAQTTFVSSAGLRIFLAAAKKLLAAGGKLRLCNPNDVVKEILQISGFTSFLEIKNNLTEALEGF